MSVSSSPLQLNAPRLAKVIPVDISLPISDVNEPPSSHYPICERCYTYPMHMVRFSGSYRGICLLGDIQFLIRDVTVLLVRAMLAAGILIMINTTLDQVALV